MSPVESKDNIQENEGHIEINKEVILKKITSELKKCNGPESLAELLNQALPLHISEQPNRKSKPVTGKILNYYAYHKKSTRYTEFKIKKRAIGQVRVIKAPARGLKRIQRLLLICLQSVFTADKAAHGFVAERNVLTNALPHVGHRFVLNIDLKDFFTNTHFGRVVAVLQLSPFSFSSKAAHLIANLCCDNGVLPQGAPTSPLLTNAVCQRLDRQLRQVATRYRCSYTRYADDITFSSNRPVFTAAFDSEVGTIIKGEGYEENEKKRRIQTPQMRQEVTGVVVNKKANVPREFSRLIRNMLHNWKTKGFEAANATLRMKYEGTKATTRYRGNIPKLDRVLAGKIAYLGMIRGKEDKSYLAFSSSLARLTNSEYVDLDELLQILEQAEAEFKQTEITGSADDRSNISATPEDN